MKQTHCTIRQLTASDLDIFFGLFSQLINTQFPEYSSRMRHWFLNSEKAWNKDNFKRIFELNSRLLLGAFDGEKLIGILEAEYPFGGVSLGIWLMVDPKYQRQGVGKALLNAWEERIKELGGHNLYLYAEKRNKKYYEKMGFTLVGLQEKAWFGLDDYIFSKIIQEPREENFLG